MGFFQQSCLLIQIQNEPCSYKDPKNCEYAIKMPCLAILSLNQGLNLQKELSYLKSTLSNWSKGNVSSKTKKTLTLRLKMLYLGIFRLTLEKTVVIFKIFTLEFVETEN